MNDDISGCGVLVGQYMADAIITFRNPKNGKKNLQNHGRYLQSVAARGVKFIAPKLPNEHLPEGLSGQEVRPPYPVTIYEMNASLGGADAVNVGCVIIAQDMGTFVELQFLMGHAMDGYLKWIAFPFFSRLKYEPTEEEVNYRGTPLAIIHTRASLVYPDAKKDKIIVGAELNQKPLVEYFGGLYLRICYFLSRHETTTVDAPPDAAENRRRRLRGQLPHYTYKVLTIGSPKKVVKAKKGHGTHASPRSHLRRGHYRTSKNGLRYWVSSAFVNGAFGFVHKDYKLKM